MKLEFKCSVCVCVCERERERERQRDRERKTDFNGMSAFTGFSPENGSVQDLLTLTELTE